MKKTSFYFMNFVNYAIYSEVLNYKMMDIEGPRATVSKNVEFILSDFLKRYKNDSINFNFIGHTLSDEKIMTYDKKAHPINIDENVLKQIYELRGSVEKRLNCKIKKIDFINIIFLEYFAKHRAEIAKRAIEFWSKNYFVRP